MTTTRRHFLRGAGTVAVGLPLFEEFWGRTAQAQSAPVPKRMVTAFFGLGLDPSWQNDFDGPLEPYRPLRDKIAFCSVDVGQGNLGGAHCNTSTVVFVGERPRSVNIAGGPSIDQWMRKELDPFAPTLASGVWWRRGACDAQALRVFNPDGSSRPPLKRPSEVFDRLFGQTAGPDPDPGPDSDTVAENRRRRMRRSVLDTVLEQVRSLQSDASPLGQQSKLKLDQHLQSIREVESRLAPAEEIIDAQEEPEPTACAAPSRPQDPPIADYDKFTYGTGDSAPEIDWQDYQRVFRLHADLWVLALRCDLVRYGNLMWESAGGHTNFRGTYRAMGDETGFPGSSQHDAYFHGNQKHHARLAQHLAQANIAYFLQGLDDSDHLEPNGKTVLDNSCVVIGTEYGWNHSKQGAFHAVAGGDGRFRSGFHTDRQMNCIDLYNAVLTAYGIDARIGEATAVESEGDGSVILA